MDSYIINLWAKVFVTLKFLSPYELCRRILPEKVVNTWGFSDSWVLGNTLIGVLALAFLPMERENSLTIVVLIWGALRVIEIIGYLFHVIFMAIENAQREDVKLNSYRRSLILAIHNYAEITIWFAIAYGVMACSFNDSGGVLLERLGSLYYSVVTITTLGYGEVTPSTSITWFLVISQTLIGLYMVLVVLGQFIGLLPKRSSHNG